MRAWRALLLYRRCDRMLFPRFLHDRPCPAADKPHARLQDAVQSSQNGIKLVWNDGVVRDFHYVWLRDQCRCDECIHPTTKQKLVDSAAIPLDICPSSVSTDDAGVLKITWTTDNHESVFEGDWLRERAIKVVAEAGRPTRKLWKTALGVESIPTTHYRCIMESNADLYKWLLGSNEHGLALVKGVPLVRDTIHLVAGRIAYAKETVYGRTFDVVAHPDGDTSHLAYTSRPLDLHTDMNYRETSPGWQMLHCLESKGPVDQGVSYFVDGISAAEWLRENHPSAFHILSSVPVEFAISTNKKKYSQHVPIIGVDYSGKVAEIHVNNRTLNTCGIPSNLIMPFFGAHKTFVTKLRDGSLEARFSLKEGDLILFDNRRILHARTGYNPKKMRRYLQGCYLDYDELTTKLQSLEEELNQKE